MAEPFAQHAVPNLVMVLRADHETIRGDVGGRGAVRPVPESGELPGINETFAETLCEIADIPEVLVITRPFFSQQAVNGVMEIVRPLGIHSIATVLTRFDQARLIEAAFGDHVNLAAQLLPTSVQSFREVLQDMTRGLVEYGVHSIEPQRVDVELRHPMQRVINDESSYGRAA